MQHNSRLGKVEETVALLKGDIEHAQIIGVNGMEVLKSGVDASYAIHQDMRGHTGGVMSLSRGIIQVQKLCHSLLGTEMYI